MLSFILIHNTSNDSDELCSACVAYLEASFRIIEFFKRFAFASILRYVLLKTRPLSLGVHHV